MISMCLAGTTYKTKKSVTEAVKKEIEMRPLGVEFVSPLISDLIANHHPYCSKHGLRPERFKANQYISDDCHEKSYEFTGYFRERGWRSVSWRKSITHPTWQSAKRLILRDACSDDLARFRFANYKCDKCGKHDPPLNCHHLTPTFQEMMVEVDALFVDADREAWEQHDALDLREFALPKDHPAIVKFLEIHSKATLIVLCVDCHKAWHGAEK